MEAPRHAVIEERICVIVNPAAGRGRGGKMIPEIKARFASVGVEDIRLTVEKGSERAVAEAAIADGCGTIVVVGGDGTTSNIANAILHSNVDVRLAVMPAGTGNDFAKVLGTAKLSVDGVAQMCVAGKSQRVDVGRIDDVFFLNCCGFGFDVAVLEEIERTPWLRGNSVYIYTALRQLLSFKGTEVGIRSGASARHPAVHLLLVIANSPHFGGSFTIAPGASLTDGKLDAVSILDIPGMRRVAVLSAATRGTHVLRPECVVESADSFDVAFAAPPMYETDGELHRAMSASVQVRACPSALRVATAGGQQIP